MRRGRALRHPDRSAPRLGLRFVVGTGHLCQIKFWLMHLWLFLDEVDNNGKNNACEDGTNDHQDAGSYPASPD